jgi:hypothetical protein
MFRETQTFENSDPGSLFSKVEEEEAEEEEEGEEEGESEKEAVTR